MRFVVRRGQKSKKGKESKVVRVNKWLVDSARDWLPQGGRGGEKELKTGAINNERIRREVLHLFQPLDNVGKGRSI